MALGATIFKVEVDLSDMDRHHYGHHTLTLARHPSETSERMMVRLIAFLQHADEQLQFTRGLSVTSEPDLWMKDLTGRTRLWVEVGMPDARRLVQASGRAEQVVVYAYGRQAPLWWNQTEKTVSRLPNLSVYLLPAPFTQALAEMAERFMRMTYSIQDSQVYLTSGGKALDVDMLSCRVMHLAA